MPNLSTILPTMMLPAIAHRHRDEFRCADPFPHAAIDGLFDHESLQVAEEAWPTPEEGGSPDWFRYEFATERCWSTNDSRAFPEPLKDVCAAMLTPEFETMLSILSGIHGLEADLNMLGGGLWQIDPSGYINAHAKFNRHTFRANSEPLFRRLTAVLFLNSAWRSQWNGGLELWDSEQCQKRIVPAMNTLAIFATGPAAWAGFPTASRAPRPQRMIVQHYWAAHPVQGDHSERETAWVR
jgi:hypothetical protein